jgi:hypothetical protein
LGQTCSLGLHCITTAARSLILNEAQAKGTAAILVTRELLDGGLCILDGIETNNTGSTRSTIRLVLNFGLLDLSDGREEFNKILIACGPWKLIGVVSLSVIKYRAKKYYLRCEHR